MMVDMCCDADKRKTWGTQKRLIEKHIYSGNRNKIWRGAIPLCREYNNNFFCNLLEALHKLFPFIVLNYFRGLYIYIYIYTVREREIENIKQALINNGFPNYIDDEQIKPMIKNVNQQNKHCTTPPS